MFQKRYEPCMLCPRRCGAHRLSGEIGYCGATAEMRLGRVALHWWEEPCLVGNCGSGAMFFSYCPLQCAYCQNASLASGDGVVLHKELRASTEDSARFEQEVDALCDMMLRLQNEEHAANINLVTPTHYVPHIAAALTRIKATRPLQAHSQAANTTNYQSNAEITQGGEPDSTQLTIPVVYNTSGYELPETLEVLNGLVDVYLTDYKYATASVARKLSYANDYPVCALRALETMYNQVGPLVFNDEGMLQQGVIVRHLVLPGYVEESFKVIDALQPYAGKGIAFSFMNQFTSLLTPAQLKRLGLETSVSDQDYNRVLDYADACGFEDYYWQEGGACEESFIPAFDGTGVF